MEKAIYPYPPTLDNNKSDLLYFFISGNRLEELYKKLFTNNGLNMPVYILEEFGNELRNETSSKVIEPAIIRRYISDIDITIIGGKLDSFATLIYNENSDNEDKSVISNSFSGYWRKIKFNTKRNVDVNDKVILSKYLKIDNIVDCNVTCRFFVIRDERYNIYGIKYADIFEKYASQFEIDRDKKKKVFIGDDFFTSDNNNNILSNLLEISPNTLEIILLPCLHEVDNSKPCSYNNNQISDNCRIFNGYEINTTLYTDFYGDDKIRKPSFFYYSNRGHCRDTNLISLVLNTYYSTDSFIKRIEENAGGRRKKITKKSKKIRRPRKKSRKTRKHKKSRKN